MEVGWWQGIDVVLGDWGRIPVRVGMLTRERMLKDQLMDKEIQDK